MRSAAPHDLEFFSGQLAPCFLPTQCGPLPHPAEVVSAEDERVHQDVAALEGKLERLAADCTDRVRLELTDVLARMDAFGSQRKSQRSSTRPDC